MAFVRFIQGFTDEAGPMQQGDVRPDLSGCGPRVRSAADHVLDFLGMLGLASWACCLWFKGDRYPESEGQVRPAAQKANGKCRP